MEKKFAFWPLRVVAYVGDKVVDVLARPVRSAVEETGFVLSVLGRSVLHVHTVFGRWRNNFFEQTARCGLGGFPVAALVAVFTGFILCQQIGIQLREFGQQSYIGALVAKIMCREMGPVMTGYILAGLIGSKMAAEIGTMKVSEEIDALEVMSINPIKFLVMPRVLAMCIVCPLLTIIADLVGILSAYFVANNILNVGWASYFKEINAALELKDITVGLLKAGIFGMTISVVGCAQGLRAEHGAEGVGRMTMRAVVIALVFIVVFDWLINWFFF